MTLNWITVNSNLKQGIILINSLDEDNFKEILNKTMLHTKNGSTSDKNELERLRQTFKISEGDLVLLIQSLAYILKQAFKVILKPTSLQQQLTECLKFNSKKAEAIVKVWTDETKASFNLEDRRRLDTIAWELNLETASNVSYKKLLPNARLQLGILGTNGNDKEHVVLELNEEELISLYRTMENIQIKLDAIQTALK